MYRPGSGAFDRRISIEQAVLGEPSASGESLKQWVLMAGGRLYAQKISEAGLERYVSPQLVAKVTIGWRVHWSKAIADVTPGDTYRIIGHDGRAYDIGDVSEEGRREFLIITGWARAE